MVVLLLKAIKITKLQFLLFHSHQIVAQLAPSEVSHRETLVRGPRRCRRAAKPREQATMFFRDPCGNALEFQDVSRFKAGI
jgi:extradiol dioxygenase family protein